MYVYFRYELDDEGHISRRHEIEAVNDDAALAACRVTAGETRFEVWLGSRLVYSMEAEVIAEPSGPSG